MKKQFVSSYFKDIKKTYTYISNDLYSFQVEGVFKNIQEFVDAYILERIQMWKDWNYDGGVWKAESDQGYINLISVINSGKFDFNTFTSEFIQRIPAKIMCCNNWLELHAFTNTCEKCNSDYNTAGQLLADRSLWGEETGEHYTDLFNLY